jgi:hypothetical protein
VVFKCMIEVLCRYRRAVFIDELDVAVDADGLPSFVAFPPLHAWMETTLRQNLTAHNMHHTLPLAHANVTQLHESVSSCNRPHGRPPISYVHRYPRIQGYTHFCTLNVTMPEYRGAIMEMDMDA